MGGKCAEDLPRLAPADLLRCVQLPEVLPAAAEQLNAVVVVYFVLHSVLLVRIPGPDNVH